MAINELRSISVFVKAAELGSLRKAAAALDISPQAASQALAQFEQHLDVRLFHRTTRVMALTDEGRRFLEEAQPSLLGLQRALRTAKKVRDEIAGPLRIVGPRTTFQPILWRLLEEFCAQYPGIVPDVQLEDRIGNWVEDRADVGFRLGLSPHEGVIARRLFPAQLVICAAPCYLAGNGVPENVSALQAHRCCAFRNPGTGKVVPWRIRIGDDETEQPVAPAICVNDEILELHAVVSGQVIGQLAGVTAAPYIRSGQLVPLLIDHMPDRYSYFVYFGSRTSQPARARAFIDLAVHRLVDNPDYVLSQKELRAASRRTGRRQLTRRQFDPALPGQPRQVSAHPFGFAADGHVVLVAAGIQRAGQVGLQRSEEGVEIRLARGAGSVQAIAAPLTARSEGAGLPISVAAVEAVEQACVMPGPDLGPGGC